MAEGLGTGLQNHLQRFESASDLTTALQFSATLFSFRLYPHLRQNAEIGEQRRLHKTVNTISKAIRFLNIEQCSTPLKTAERNTALCFFLRLHAR